MVDYLAKWASKFMGDRRVDGWEHLNLECSQILEDLIIEDMLQ